MAESVAEDKAAEDKVAEVLVAEVLAAEVLAEKVAEVKVVVVTERRAVLETDQLDLRSKRRASNLLSSPSHHRST